MAFPRRKAKVRPPADDNAGERRDEADAPGRVARKLQKSREDVQKAVSSVAGKVSLQLTAFRRRIRRLQARAREQREARREARQADGPRRRGARGRAFQMRGSAANNAKDLRRKAEELERQLDVRQAIKAYEEAAMLVPNNFDVLARCSKAWSDATYLDEIKGKFREPLTTDMKRDVNQKAYTYSEKAIAANPKASLPHVAACISMGRLALFSDNKAKVKLAKDAREHAITALQLEPDSDLAHHLMGRWHWEMAQLNVVARTLIRLAFGTALPPGTHHDALQSYRTATKLSPGRLIHRVELGRAYHKLGRREEAWRELEAAITLDVEDINAHLQKIDADDLLKGLRRDAAKHHWVVDPEQQSKGTEEQGQEGFVIRLPLMPKAHWFGLSLPKPDKAYSTPDKGAPIS